jgi:hypothetical protein
VKKAREEVKKMKAASLTSNLVVSSALLWGAATLNADDVIVKTPLDLPGYCHLQFPEMRPETLDWDRPMLDDSSGSVVDFYGSCDHDPMGADALKSQRRVILRGLCGDGE